MIGVIMPRYIIERTLPKMSQEEMQQLARRSIQVADGIPGVVWIKSYISESEGKTYCEYEAPNPRISARTRAYAEYFSRKNHLCGNRSPSGDVQIDRLIRRHSLGSKVRHSRSALAAESSE